MINLGCGFDTLFWRLKALYKVQHMKTFVDIDLDGVTMQKVLKIRHRPKLLSHLGEDIKMCSTELHSSNYHLIAADLRLLGKHDYAEHLKAKLITECGVDRSLPTVVLSECVLVYMQEAESHELLTWLSSNLEHALYINYEQVNMGDRFGEIMLENLRQRQCELLGVGPAKGTTVIRN